MDYNIPVLQPIEIEPFVISKPAEPTPPEPILYTIVVGDTLTSISELHNVDLSRLWAANPELTNPDLITPDKPLKIPAEGDVLPEREMPSNIVVRGELKAQGSSPTGMGSFTNSGNTYDFHSCTWYAKSRRPDIPNNWHNASNWFSAAQSLGWPTGTQARAGAIGQKGNHVVYIERVEGSRVYLSERNYDYHGSYRERWANASDFRYIY